MYNSSLEKIDIKELEKIAIEMANTTENSEIFLLDGELGVGKTTFARFLIKAFFKKYTSTKIHSVKSPSFPIMINYQINNFEILHYDFYRLNRKSDLIELNFFENIKSNITIVEWPDLVISELKDYKYVLLKFKFFDKNKRSLKIISNLH